MWDASQLSSAGTRINRRSAAHSRTLYADPALARRLGELGEPTVPEEHSGPYVLHDSELGAARAVYIADEREEFDEAIEVYVVEVCENWGEIEVPMHAHAVIAEACAMIRTHGRDWEFSTVMARLFMALEGSIVAISVPVGDGRLIWMPMLTLVRGMITVREPVSVQMRRQHSNWPLDVGHVDP